MKKLCLALCVVPSSLLLHGCASPPAETHSWTIEPRQSIHHATNRPDGFYQLGRYYQGQNRLDLALKAYQRALELDSNFTEAHNGLGTIYALQGKYDEALAAFNAAAAQTPDAAHVHNNIGYLNFLKGNYAEAVAAFTKATTLDKTNQRAWNNLALALAKIDKPMASNQAFAQALESKSPSPSAARSEAPEEPAALTLPKDRGVIVYAADAKTRSVAENQAGVSNLAQDARIEPAALARPAKESSPLPSPPFAVLTKANPSVMPEVSITGEEAPAVQKMASASTRMVEGKIARAPLLTPQATPAESAPPTPSIREAVPVQPVAVVATTGSGMLQQAGPAKAAYLKVAAPATPASPAAGASPMERMRSFALEVANGNGINKLAARFRSILSAEGFPAARLTNLKPFNQPRTVIYYRSGHRVAAAQLKDRLSTMNTGAFLLITESKQLPSHTDVKLVLGKDLSNPVVVTSINKSPQT